MIQDMFLTAYDKLSQPTSDMQKKRMTPCIALHGSIAVLLEDIMLLIQRPLWLHSVHAHGLSSLWPACSRHRFKGYNIHVSVSSNVCTSEASFPVQESQCLRLSRRISCSRMPMRSAHS